MNTDRIPTTDEIRDAYVGEPAHFMDDLVRAEFDAWLAAHDREVQARVLEEFADSITPHVCDVIEDGPRRTREYVANTARSHAAALRTPAEENPRG